MNKIRIRALDLVLLCLGLVFFVGILTVFQPCGPREDGSWMSCHWAGRALAGVAGTMLLLAAFRLAVKPEVKRGLDLALLVLCALAALLPGRLIALCAMPDMRCRTLMAPCAVVFPVLTALTALLDLIVFGRGGKTP